MKSCLTVDDSKIIRKISSKIIEELGLKAMEACDGQEALNQCAKEMPNCILLDWNMPVMDGMEFLKNFRSDSKNKDVVIIFCTSVNEVSKIQEAIIAGANEYIMKPFDKEMVKDKLIQTGIL